MKIKQYSKGGLCAALIWAAPVFAESTQPLSLIPESALWLVGDSTLHAFTCRTSELKLTAEVEPAAQNLRPEALLTGALKQMELSLSVKSLKSKESALDNNMYKALHAETYPEIVFLLGKYDVVPSTSSAGVSRITASGMLRIAGDTQPVVLHMDAEPVNGVLRVRGQYSLLMTDYGIKPPTMMLGTIKVRNPVEIHFDLGLR